MAEDNSNNEGGGASETPELTPEQNVKAEFNRKFANMNEQLASTNQALAQVLESMKAQQQAPQVPTKPLKDMVFDDPEQFVKTVEARALQAANQVVDNRVRMSGEAQTVISELQSKYPEFSAPNSEATQYALQIAARQPEGIKGTALGARQAMMEAVAQYDLVPASKRQTRQQDNDSFVAGGQGTGTRKARENDPTKGVDPITLEFAQLLDPSIASDPKRLESLKQSSTRKNWNRYS